jgi:phenylacetate-CoA ligase
MHPAIVRTLLLPLHERLKNTSTFACLREIEQTQWLDSAALRELQFARLRRHLEFAYRQTPYYRRLLDEHELPPHRIQSFDDFARVPPLTRDLLRRNFSELQARHCRLGRVQALSTGGSTGQPVTVLTDTSVGFGPAVRYRAHRWFGLQPGAREIVLWGSPIEITRQDRLRTVRDWLINSKLLSAFDLGEDALAAYTNTLTRYRPQKMYGYASALYLFARHLERVGWRPAWKLNAIFTTAEPLFDFQRRTIEAVFECPVAVEYGARDAGLLATQCPQGGLHVAAEGVVVEVDGRGADGLGEIVVTNLYTPAMPIVRYRTGDMGQLDHRPCPCGRSLPLLKSVDGRRTDFLITPAGRVLHALSAIYILREMASVRAFQIIQEAIDRVVVYVVPEREFTADHRAHVRARMQRLLGREVNIQLEAVTAIVSGPSGKFRYVISHVADDYLNR